MSCITFKEKNQILANLFLEKINKEQEYVQ